MISAWKFGSMNCLVLATTALTGISASAQSKQSPEFPFLNPKRAPVILELNADKEQVRNRSSKKIVRYWLCYPDSHEGGLARRKQHELGSGPDFQ